MKTAVDIWDATLLGSMRHLTCPKAQFKPNHHEHSTFHTVSDGKHCDLIIPFSQVFVKDVALNDGFSAGLTTYLVGQDTTIPPKQRTSEDNTPASPPSPPPDSNESHSMSKNELSDKFPNQSQVSKHPADSTSLMPPGQRCRQS